MPAVGCSVLLRPITITVIPALQRRFLHFGARRG
jgi:hypothetical protein